MCSNKTCFLSIFISGQIGFGNLGIQKSLKVLGGENNCWCLFWKCQLRSDMVLETMLKSLDLSLQLVELIGGNGSD